MSHTLRGVPHTLRHVHMYVHVYTCVRASHTCVLVSHTLRNVLTYVHVYTCVHASHTEVCTHVRTRVQMRLTRSVATSSAAPSPVMRSQKGKQGQHTVRMASAAQNTKMTKGIIAQSGEIELARSRDYPTASCSPPPLTLFNWSSRDQPI